MDVIYDVVESIHIFIPVVAIVFICVVLYINSRKEIEETTVESILCQENIATSKTKEDKKSE